LICDQKQSAEWKDHAPVFPHGISALNTLKILRGEVGLLLLIGQRIQMALMVDPFFLFEQKPSEVDGFILLAS
jgi:hypothetical protein